jgi:hypothetical protein
MLGSLLRCVPCPAHNKSLQGTSGQRGFTELSHAAKTPGCSKLSAAILRLPLSSNVLFLNDMNKKKYLSIFLVTGGFWIAVILSGCAGTNIKRLSGTEFLNQANRIEEASSFYWTTYIGISKKRAYLEYGYPAFIGDGMRTTILWAPLAELPEPIAQQLKAGSSPWKNW